MGWHPTSQEFANFPNPPIDKWWRGTIRRGKPTGRGTPKHKCEHENKTGGGRRNNRPYYKILRRLVADSMAVGYLNGKRLAKKRKK